MLISLRSSPRRPEGSDDTPDVVDLLLDCHGRIRKFSQLAVRLAEAPAPLADVADAAAQVLRYFSVALPLHVLDEDEMLTPRLVALPPPLEVAGALGTMARQHREIDALLEDLLRYWAELAEVPGRRSSMQEVLVEGSALLVALFDEHLRIEEETIFPAVRQLVPVEARRAMAEQARQRRASQLGGVG